MKIRVRIGDVEFEMEMPSVKPSVFDTSHEFKGVIELVKLTCSEALKMYQDKHK